MQPRRWRAGHKPGKMQSAAKEVKQAVTKYEWYKAHGICPTCGCRDAAPGRVQCPECLEKERLKAVQRRKKESPEQKEYHNRHRQRRTDLLHAFGVCVRCQRRDAAPGRAQCVYCLACALPGFVDSKNEEKTERNAGYLVVSHSGGGMLRQGTRKGIRRTPANRGMRAHWVVKGLDISEDVCHGMCP